MHLIDMTVVTSAFYDVLATIGSCISCSQQLSTLAMATSMTTSFNVSVNFATI